jgi:hypothetical protein
MAKPTEAGETGLSTKAKAAAVRAQDKATEALDTVRGKVGNLQATLADTLDARAGALREATGGDAETDQPRRGSRVPRRVTDARQSVAGGLDHTAVWLRENDLTDLGGLLREQLRRRPGRTALIVFGLGFIVGRASRR